MSDNALIEFLRDEKIRIIASKMPAFQSNIIDSQKASDFDIYNALAVDLYLLSGHPIKDTFLNLLVDNSQSEISCELLSDMQYRNELWRRMFCDSDIILPQPQVKPIECKEKSNFKKRKFYSIDYTINANFDNIHSLLDYTLNEIRTSNAESIYFDARSITFIRPDDFHAQIEYDNLKNGREDISVLKLWLLCRILMNTKLSVKLKVEKNKDVEDILNLVFRLGLYPNVVISFELLDNIDYSAIYEFLLYHHKKNISLEIFCPKENDEIIKKFLSIVPMIFVESINSKVVR
jgi:hypothetical protein